MFKLMCLGIVLMVSVNCNENNPPTPKCDLNVDCPAETPFCVDGICLMGKEIPSCDGWTDCEAGFHCLGNQCLPKCNAGRDCCIDAQDCLACDTSDVCNEFRCVSSGRCQLITPVADCALCDSMGWMCEDTAPECYLGGVCNVPGDCDNGQVCIDLLCAPCTDDAQCPLQQVCDNGACGEVGNPNTDTTPDPGTETCNDNSDCNSLDHDAVDYYCRSASPRYCTIACSGNPGQAKKQCEDENLTRCENNECIK
jgi:hypothetical protein